ncbi:hypothetical protein DRE_04100 [Drechslerella stenobrocha 248]|uniref:Methyltransferase domain-containing protein n=1 Tax=Drechslerella stenobrocha 248 TaxID=1043628 RepID=W7I363_9PEZI|nr:hypothetical protein DRE_04100 [Drechslerella stenobrocha 248]
MASSSPPTTQHMPTTSAYDLWSAVYDTDGNVLQQLDDGFVDAHLPALVAALPTSTPPPTIIDLGCGTGRNTLKLAKLSGGIHVVALDNSQGMLAQLHHKLQDANVTNVRVCVQDLSSITFPDAALRSAMRQGSTATNNDEAAKAAGIISTLVLEHLPLHTFFAAIPKPAIRSREEILQVASDYGFTLDGAVGEEGVRDAAHAKELGVRAEKWIGVKMHLGMVLRMMDTGFII